MAFFVEKTFLDTVARLDGDVFTRCTFDGCVIRYEGGPTAINGPTNFIGENRLDIGDRVPPDNPISTWLITQLSTGQYRRLDDD